MTRRIRFRRGPARGGPAREKAQREEAKKDEDEDKVPKYVLTKYERIECEAVWNHIVRINDAPYQSSRGPGPRLREVRTHTSRHPKLVKPRLQLSRWNARGYNHAG